MHTLFLTSIHLTGLETVFDIPLRDIKLAYIPTAADPYDDKWFLEEDRQRMRQMGIRFTEFDIKDKNANSLHNDLKDFDAIFISGGNVFYLLEKVRESGFDTVVTDLVDRGMVYIGASAGAVLAGPDIGPLAPLDDPGKAPGLTSTAGLCLIDSIILPHYGNPKYASAYETVMRNLKNTNQKLLPLTDSQSLVFRGSEYTVIFSASENSA